MELIKQTANDGEDGCGIACVAMLAGLLKYKKAKTKSTAHWETEGTSSEELRSELAKYGIETEPLKSVSSEEQYKSFNFDAALLGKIDKDEHWAVWDAERELLLDPYPHGGDFVCASFIEVTKRP